MLKSVIDPSVSVGDVLYVCSPPGRRARSFQSSSLAAMCLSGPGRGSLAPLQVALRRWLCWALFLLTWLTSVSSPPDFYHSKRRLICSRGSPNPACWKHVLVETGAHCRPLLYLLPWSFSLCVLIIIYCFNLNASSYTYLLAATLPHPQPLELFKKEKN